MMPPAILALIQFDKQAMTETEKAVHTEKKAKGNSAVRKRTSEIYF